LSNAATPPVSRNAPCPCGSNKRYKECHGAVAAPFLPPPGTLEALPTMDGEQSLYRPSGPDWDHLPEVERAACGILMQRALQKQQAGELAEAAAAYKQVLALAPHTHDALHMLGAIEMRRGNLGEAKRLIVAALKLREPYPNIEHNLRMVEDLGRAARVEAGGAPVPTEELCDQALPSLVELALRPTRHVRLRSYAGDRGQGGVGPRFHLIGGVLDSSDDGAWLLTRLASLLAPLHPTVWSAVPRRDGSAAGSAMRCLAPDIGDLPRGGCQIYVGLDIDCSEWIDRTDPERTVVFCQPIAPSQCLDQLRAISRDGARPIDLVFPSRAIAGRFGASDSVLPPPIEPDARLAEQVSELGVAGSSRCAVGLFGRHWQGISPSEDAEFLRRVATVSGPVEIYDPGQLRYLLGAEPTIRFSRRGAGALQRFVSAVDCVLHVAGKWWLEGDGRELLMAMASGTPIVCPRTSVFAEYIDHGVDGLLYDDREEAVELLGTLRSRSALGVTLGRAARAKTAALLAPARVAHTVRQLVVGENPLDEPSNSGDLRQVALAR
jgi:hypothetical protein